MFSKSQTHTDPSQNFMEAYPHQLDPLFHPNSIAVIGAKDDQGSVGRTIMVNLLSSTFKGHLFPINPKRDQVLGLKSYPDISSLPEKIDLAIIVTPAQTVPKIVEECVQAGVKSAIIISAGFKELGESGLKLEQEILFHAKKVRMPIIGPNCLGVMNPINGLNATFARGMALPGNLAFISQSGAMCTAVLDWSLQNNVGFSAFVSIGSMADVNWGTLIDYLGSDPHTHSLLLYMETVGDARSFMTAAREVALEKPIIVIKAGRSQAAAQAAASHTGSLSGSDEVFDAALERVGVLRVNSIGELFNMASVLGKQPLPRGPNLTIITNAGGPGVLATDAAIFNQAKLTSLSSSTIDSLNGFLPPAWSHGNPVDLLGDADAIRYGQAIEIISHDQETDGLLVVLSPQDMTDSTGTAARIKQLENSKQKTLLASWMGGESIKEGAAILSNAKIPVFEYPDDAAKAFAMMWAYHQNLQSLYELPIKKIVYKQEQKSFEERHHVKELIEKVQKEGRTLLTEFESKKVLEKYHIPIVKTETAHSVEEAAQKAEDIGFPVVLKLLSQTITHKTDIGGVKLNLKTKEQVSEAYNAIKEAAKEHFEGVTVQKMINLKGIELILGSSTDPQFGPVLLFGLGGELVEIFKDRALAIPPLTLNLAKKCMQKTKIYEALLGVRGRKAVPLSELEEILINFSLLIVENPRIKECDINPLLASEEGCVALDARIILHENDITDENLPTLAIRPYPYGYILSIELKNGLPVILRPILPEDAPLLTSFHKELSENSVRQRYFEFLSLNSRVAHDRLIRICFNDYNKEWAIVAEIEKEKGKEIIGVGRLIRIPGTPHAQFKLLIQDAYHQLGLGTQLIKHLLKIAKEENILEVHGHILSENKTMLNLCQKLGFNLDFQKDPNVVFAEKKTSEIDS